MSLLASIKKVFYKIVPVTAQQSLIDIWHAGKMFPLIVIGFRRAREIKAGLLLEKAVNTETVITNPLQLYFNAHTEGPGIWKWQHYFEIYHHHFSKFIGQEVRILEIGIYSGGSLGMWKSYFGPKCTVYGVDIEPSCKSYESDSVKVFIGDQSDRKFWERFRKEAPPIDIVVDDGGHLTHQQVITFEEVFPHMRPGGVFLCEDLQGRYNPYLSYMHGLSLHLHQDKPQTNNVQSMVHSIHTYPYVSVVEKAKAPIQKLISKRHGTQWQPYLRDKP